MWRYQPFPGVSLAGSFTFARMAIALFTVCHLGIFKNKKKGGASILGLCF